MYSKYTAALHTTYVYCILYNLCPHPALTMYILVVVIPWYYTSLFLQNVCKNKCAVCTLYSVYFTYFRLGPAR